ncbi:MAG: prepilin-type N-terminal cleavage/methylation domain-containing protein [Gemmatimonadota bacterium]
MPAIPSTPPFPIRRGVTLLELLVVLVLMAVAASVVLPVFGVRPAGSGSADAGSGLDVVIASARRSAIQRGAPVHLRVATDGVWALAAAVDGELLSGGRIELAAGSVAASRAIDLQIDAMGSCLPGTNTPAGTDASTTRSTLVPDAPALSFDALACRFAPDASP